MITTKCDFTYEHYQDLLEECKKVHKLVSFEESLRTKSPHIIIRHDIDFSIDKALKMAGLEKIHKIKSTYFILFHSSFYNPMQEKTLDKIKNIHTMGHDIGLHYNSNFGTDIMLYEIETLSKAIGTKITAISKHNPYGIKSDIQYPEYLYNAYSERFTKKIKYLSDSSQIWREGCLCTNVSKFSNIQVLIHPEWWGYESMTPDRTLLDITDQLILDVNILRREALDNLQKHRALIKSGVW